MEQETQKGFHANKVDRMHIDIGKDVLRSLNIAEGNINQSAVIRNALEHYAKTVGRKFLESRNAKKVVK